MADKMPDVTITAASAPKKRGRPVGSTNKGSQASINADVAKAMATLDSAYNLIATGLMMFGLTEATKSWIDSAEELKKTNKDALQASPKLASYIANAGSAGGAGTFFITHGMAFYGVARVASNELAERRAERESKRDSKPGGFDAPDMPDHDPTLIPGM